MLDPYLMKILINLIEPTKTFSEISRTLFSVKNKIFAFALKPSQNVNHQQLCQSRLKCILDLNEMYTLKNMFFRSDILDSNNLVIKTKILGFFITVIKKHHELKFIKNNEYIGIFKQSFKDSIKILQNKAPRLFFSEHETQFLQTFLRLFQFSVKKHVPMDIEVFESRNELITKFFFPLLSLEEKEASDLQENPKEFVNYAHDYVDSKNSQTLKSQVLLLFETLCEFTDGFHVFACDYLSQVLLYSIFYSLFYDAAHSKLESIYCHTTSGLYSTLVNFMNSIWGCSRQKFEQLLLSFLGVDSSSNSRFASVLEVREFYDQHHRGKQETLFRVFPIDIEGIVIYNSQKTPLYTLKK